MWKQSIVLASLAGSLGLGNSAQALTPHELAFHHAPVHYQDTDSSDYPSDYITSFDYDNDPFTTNNWDNRGNGLWPATVYYSVVESCSHYFISYSFYHPRDWSDNIFDTEHENDLEGTLIAVRKDGSAYGTLEGMVTVFHTDFFSYTPPGSPFTKGHETIDGKVSFEWHDGVNRMRTVQEAKGHGLKAWPYTSDFNGANNQDGIVYFPTLGAPTAPASGNDRRVYYRLVDIQSPSGLFDLAIRDATQPPAQFTTFVSWGTFAGNESGGCGAGLKSCGMNSANTPWGWDDGNDGPSYRGEFALDPAKLFSFYFGNTAAGPGGFSQQYLDNPFLTKLRDAGFYSGHAPAGFPSQLDLNTMYAKLTNSCVASN